MKFVAATPLVKISVMLQKEFLLPITREIFWTDSEAVLGYIRKKVQSVCNKQSWIYLRKSLWLLVVSCKHQGKPNWLLLCIVYIWGTDVNNTKATETWFNGPSFLWESESTWTSKRKIFDVSSNDPELKTELRKNYTEVSFDTCDQLEEKISTWERMKRVMFWVLSVVCIGVSTPLSPLSLQANNLILSWNVPVWILSYGREKYFCL